MHSLLFTLNFEKHLRYTMEKKVKRCLRIGIICKNKMKSNKELQIENNCNPANNVLNF